MALQMELVCFDPFALTASPVFSTDFHRHMLHQHSIRLALSDDIVNEAMNSLRIGRSLSHTPGRTVIELDRRTVHESHD